MKKIIQRNLPLNECYKILSFKYVPLMDGEGTCCENCGKLISNMVTLENSKLQKFVVGNDCANTLTIDKSKMFFEVEPAFNEGKSLRAKIMKNFKNNTISKAYIWNNKSNEPFLIMQTPKNASSMEKILHFDITFQYIKDLLTNQ